MILATFFTQESRIRLYGKDILADFLPLGNILLVLKIINIIAAILNSVDYSIGTP